MQALVDYAVGDLRRIEPEEGLPYYEADLIAGGERGTADTRRGAWRLADRGRHLLPQVAADLQAAVKTLERKRSRASTTA